MKDLYKPFGCKEKVFANASSKRVNIVAGVESGDRAVRCGGDELADFFRPAIARDEYAFA